MDFILKFLIFKTALLRAMRIFKTRALNAVSMHKHCFFLVYDVIHHFPILFSSTFYKLQRLKNISYLFISFSRIFSKMLEFI